ncbi:MAG: hypothetical protein HQL87_09750, partial [Magnetococcales bacterium]|nr:hypothetical protein [Magnetococcales bacterium]
MNAPIPGPIPENEKGAALPSADPQDSTFDKSDIATKTHARQGFDDDAFRRAMLDDGIEIDGPILADGQLHRVHAVGDKKLTKNAWYIYHFDSPASGAYGHWGLGINQKWTAKHHTAMSAQDREILQRRIEADRKAREVETAKRHTEKRRKAQTIWDNSKAGPDDHPHLARKGVKSHGLRITDWGVHQKDDHGAWQEIVIADSLIVPMRDTDGTIHSLQALLPDKDSRLGDRDKDFLSGGRKAGLFHQIGTINPNGPLIIIEGYSTGGTVYESTGVPILVAFDAGNLQPVAEAIHAKYLKCLIFIGGDLDASGTGQTKADAAAKAVGGLVIFPPFTEAELHPPTSDPTPEDPDPKPPKAPSDWNDYKRLHGPDAVREAITKAMESRPQEPEESDPDEEQIQSALDGLDHERKAEDALSEKLSHLLSRNKSGEIHPNLNNATVILSNHPAFVDWLGYDEFNQTVMLMNRPPWAPIDGDWQQRPLQDVDALNFLRWLQGDALGDNKISTIGLETVRQAVDLVAHYNKFHPVKDWMEGLVWDGEKRLSTWFARHIGSTDSRYSRSVGRLLFISMIARIYKPGCKCDTVVVFCGKQGSLKSSVFYVIGGQWFKDTSFSLESKDAFINLKGCLLYELAELDAMRKAEVEKVKAFISSATDSYRPPYGRNTVDVPRQTVFVGTTNNQEFLKDSTGNRRFLPIEVGIIDLDGLKNER